MAFPGQPNSPMPPQTAPGRCRIWLVHCSDLRDVSPGTKVPGSDPYVAVRIGPRGSGWMSKVAPPAIVAPGRESPATGSTARQALSASARNRRSPEWCEELTVSTGGFPKGVTLELHFRVFDNPDENFRFALEQGGYAGEDDYLCEATVPIGASELEAGEGAEKSYALEDGPAARPRGRAAWAVVQHLAFT